VTTGSDFFSLRRAIIRWPTLHHVGDETLGARESRLFFEKSKEQLARGTNERLATFIFGATRRLTDHHHARAGWASSDNHSGANLGEVTLGAREEFLHVALIH
jgi:hypothetical protein